MLKEKTHKKFKLPNYQDLDQILRLMHSELSPAECQGIALGLLAWDNQSKAAQEWKDFLDQEFPSFGLTHIECKKHLEAVFESAFSDLKNDHFGLKLYLPQDKISLPIRAQALSQWCKGFMFGLGLMGFDNRMLSNAFINEALQDISQIMNIDVNFKEQNEQSEKEYFELVEYLRMATLLIYTEISGIDQGAGKSAHGLH